MDPIATLHMTRKRVVALMATVLSMALALGSLAFAVPVTAAELELDTGVIEGDADVRKVFKFCRKNEATKLVEYEIKENSPGIGLPTDEKKNAWWGIDGVVTSTVKGVGDLVACGFLGPMVDEDVEGNEVQLGAACGASKGWNGIGTIAWRNGGQKGVPGFRAKDHGITQLHDITWKVSIGGTLPVTANLVEPKDKNEKIGLLEATVQATGGGPCLEKADPKGDPKNGPPSGATEFAVNGVYEAVRHYDKAEPVLPKKDDEYKKPPDEKPPDEKPAEE